MITGTKFKVWEISTEISTFKAEQLAKPYQESDSVVSVRHSQHGECREPKIQLTVNNRFLNQVHKIVWGSPSISRQKDFSMYSVNKNVQYQGSPTKVLQLGVADQGCNIMHTILVLEFFYRVVPHHH